MKSMCGEKGNGVKESVLRGEEDEEEKDQGGLKQEVR